MSALAYRPFRDDDLPGLLALWEASGWGALDEATWRQWFLTTPHGPAIVIVALDGDTVEGQMVFTPAVLDADGGPFQAVRLAAPILHPSIRKGSARSLAHPAVRLFKTGAAAATAAGYDAIYAQPERAWLPFFRWGPIAERFGSTEFGCAALELDATPAPEGWTAALADGFGDEHEALWDQARTGFETACGVRREAPWLQYRLGSHAVVEARAGDVLQGYAAVRQSDGLLMDAVAATPQTLARTLVTVASAVAAIPDRPFGALKAMRTPAWAEALQAAGFHEDDYRFAAVVCPLSDRFPAAAVDPAAWYAVPAD